MVTLPTRVNPHLTVEDEIPEPEPEHPYRQAKDAAYAPPAAKNVGALPTYKNQRSHTRQYHQFMIQQSRQQFSKG